MPVLVLSRRFSEDANALWGAAVRATHWEVVRAAGYAPPSELEGRTDIAFYVETLLADGWAPALGLALIEPGVLDREVVTHSAYMRDGDIARAGDGSWPLAPDEEQGALSLLARVCADPRSRSHRASWSTWGTFVDAGGRSWRRTPLGHLASAAVIPMRCCVSSNARPSMRRASAKKSAIG